MWLFKENKWLIFLLLICFNSSAYAQQALKHIQVYQIARDYRDPVVNKTDRIPSNSSAVETKEILGTHIMSENKAIYKIPGDDIAQGWRIQAVIPFSTWERYVCGACGSRNCEFLETWERIECRHDIPVYIKPDLTAFYLQEDMYPAGSFYQNSEHPHKGMCYYKIILKKDPTLATTDANDLNVLDSEVFGIFNAQYRIPKQQKPQAKPDLPVEITWLLDTSGSMKTISQTLTAHLPQMFDQVLSRMQVYRNYAINADGITLKDADWAKLTSKSALTKLDQVKYLAEVIKKLPKGSDDEKPLKSYIDFLAKKAANLPGTHQYLILFTDEDDSSEYDAQSFINTLHQNYPSTEFTLILFVNSMKAKKLVGINPIDGIRVKKFNLFVNDIRGFENNLKRLTAQMHIKKDEVLSKNLTLKLPSGYSIHRVLDVLVNGKQYKDFLYNPKNLELMLSLEAAAGSADIRFAGNQN